MDPFMVERTHSENILNVLNSATYYYLLNTTAASLITKDNPELLLLLLFKTDIKLLLLCKVCRMSYEMF